MNSTQKLHEQDLFIDVLADMICHYLESEQMRKPAKPFFFCSWDEQLPVVTEQKSDSPGPFWFVMRDGVLLASA